MSKPREWYLNLVTGCYYLYSNLPNSTIHVIEYSAYEAALKEIDRLDIQTNDFHDRLSVAIREQDALREPNIYKNPMAADAFKMGHRACEENLLKPERERSQKLVDNLNRILSELEDFDQTRAFTIEVKKALAEYEKKDE